MIFRRWLIGGLLTFAATSGWAAVEGQGEAYTAEGAVVINSDEVVQWHPAPESLPPGAQVAVIEGDPEALNQVLTLRLKMPKGYIVPPHWHPVNEYVTVLSGELLVGYSDELKPEQAHTISEGGLFSTPPKVTHFVQAREDTVIQLHAYGPFRITYVNPEDDPRNKD